MEVDMPRDTQKEKTSWVWYTVVPAVVGVAFIAFSMWIYARPVWDKAVTERQQLEEIRRQNDLMVEQNTVLERIAVCLEKWAKEEDDGK
jgi:hypothetical protein